MSAIAAALADAETAEAEVQRLLWRLCAAEAVRDEAQARLRDARRLARDAGLPRATVRRSRPDGGSLSWDVVVVRVTGTHVTTRGVGMDWEEAHWLRPSGLSALPSNSVLLDCEAVAAAWAVSHE